MKVICIVNKWNVSKEFKHAARPKYGEVVTVTNATIKEDNQLHYQIYGYGDLWYVSKNFAPVEDTDSALDEVNKILETAFINH